METQRTRRVGELLKEEIGEIIETELKDPRLGLITVTDVEVSPDLRQATVYVGILADEPERTQSLKILGKAAGFIQSKVGKRVRLKYTPQLRFVLDTSIDESIKITRLLRKIHGEE
jgi:ribosome-binding factor A